MGRARARHDRRRLRGGSPAAGNGGCRELTRILVVCTANRCRSPMAAAMLHARLAARGVDAGVASAGFLDEGIPPPEPVRAALARRGLRPLADHSRRISPALLRRADLVLTMERAHAREAVLAVPEAWPVTFPLKDLVRRARHLGARSPAETIHTWLRRAHLGRTRAALLGSAGDDDVADPMGGLDEDYERAAEELEDLVTTLTDMAWPSPAHARSA